MSKTTIDYQTVTETAGSKVAEEQVRRMYNRYKWAASLCSGKDVIEVACGTGQGLNILVSAATTLRACDISSQMVKIAKKSNIDSQIEIEVCDAQKLPYNDNSADIIVFFEAIYYIENIKEFMLEVKRVLRSNGELLISTANCDLFDFNPSPYSIKYYGAKDLQNLAIQNKIDLNLYGDCTLRGNSKFQNFLRIIKFCATKLNLIPNTMAAKKFLKRFVFGDLISMPKKLTSDLYSFESFPTISPEPNHEYKVILARFFFN